ncbi:MAG TPA: DUF4038 domain-containing protein [Rhodothermales bacterium]
MSVIRILLLITSSLVAASCVGPASSLRDASQATPLWGRWERAFVAERPPADVAFTVTFTAPSGATHRVRGFWDGGLVWRVRFMPNEEGLWSYESHARPYVAGLSSRRGTFVCFTQRHNQNRFLQHGPVGVSPSGPFFAHRDGTPFFWLGDTAWNGPLRSSRADWDAYLLARREQRFSVIQFVATQWRAAASDRLGLQAYSGYDDITINPAFFQRLDARIDAINRAGLLAAPVLLWELGDPQTAPGQLPESQAIELARYLRARYGAHHVAWFLGGDADYRGERAERWKRIGRAVFGEGVDAPVFLHPQGMQWPWDAFRDEEWLTALGYQSGHGDDAATLAWIHSGPAAEAGREETRRPIVNLEPPYEDHVAYQSGERHAAYNVRRAVYWSLLATPTAGVSYGAHGVWSWEVEPAVPMNHPNAGLARPWFEAVTLPGGADMRHVAELFERIPWWRLRPDPELVVGQSPDPARFIGAARTPDALNAVVYLPRGGEVTLDRRRISTGTQATWFNPRDGRQSTASPVRNMLYAAPDTLDWVLLFTPRPPASEP